MSLFRVVRNGMGMMGTDYVSCISFEHLDSQEKAGYTFEVNGKKMTAKQVKKYFNYDDKTGKVSHTESPTISVSSDVKPIEQPKKKSNRGRKVKCIQNGKIYTNMSECAKDLGIDSAAVSYSLQVNRPTKGGYSFEFVD